jgi:DNA-binding MarR family transcriptional regulator
VPAADLEISDYQALGEFRYLIRRFLRASEGIARGAGLEPQQHQALLAIKALGHPVGPTVSALAESLLVRHHSAVGLVDRLEHRGLVARIPGTGDKREVRLSLTAAGEELLRGLSRQHQVELQVSGPALAKALAGLLDRNKSGWRESE